MSGHYDALETRDPGLREREQFAQIARQVAFAKAHAPALARRLADVRPEAIVSREALARLPVMRKAELSALQKEAPPFGGLRRGAGRCYRAANICIPRPGLRARGRRARLLALRACAVRRGLSCRGSGAQLLCLPFHSAGSMLESGAHALGCTVFPGGAGQAEQQVAAMADLKPAGYVGTPSFLRIILERADELGIRLPSLTKALVSDRRFRPSLRDALGARGVAAYQAYGTADVGAIAYETSARDGLVVDEGVLVEIVHPGTGDPVTPGEVGEVVVTPLANRAYPLIRYGTGDLSAALPGESSCGRTNMRIKGWLGRADQTAKVKGMFVHPAQVAAIVKRHPEVRRARLVVDNPGGTDRMILQVEVSGMAASLAESIVESIREVTRLRGEVSFRAVDEVPERRAGDRRPAQPRVAEGRQ